MPFRLEGYLHLLRENRGRKSLALHRGIEASQTTDEVVFEQLQEEIQARAVKETVGYWEDVEIRFWSYLYKIPRARMVKLQSQVFLPFGIFARAFLICKPI